MFHSSISSHGLSGIGTGAARSRHRAACQELPWVFEYSGLWPHPVSLVDTLSATYGHLEFARLQGSYGWVIRNDQAKNREALGISKLGDYLRLFRQPNGPKLPYLMHLSINRHLRRLRSHFVLPPEFTPNWADLPGLDRFSGPELFIGQRGTGFGPVHVDHVAVHVGFIQLEGEKEFLLFPPEDGAYLYRYAGGQFPWQLRNSRVYNLEAASLDRFPLLRRTHPVSLVLKAGQALFMPANWWHTTMNHSNTVSYSIRIVNHTNVLRTVAEYAAGLPRLPSRLGAHVRPGRE